MKKDLKALKNQNNMLFSITKKSRSRFELKNINNVREKASKKRCDSISNYSSDELDSDSLLSSDIDCDKHRQPTGSKEINRLDHTLTNNIKKNKDQLNDSNYNDPIFDTNSFNLSRRTRDPLPVVTVTLQEG